MISIKCTMCNAPQELNISQTQYQDWRLNRESLPVVQDHFPELTDAQRELLISGVCGGCFDELFGDSLDFLNVRVKHDADS